MDFEAKIAELGLLIPKPAKPAGFAGFGIKRPNSAILASKSIN